MTPPNIAHGKISLGSFIKLSVIASIGCLPVFAALYGVALLVGLREVITRQIQMNGWSGVVAASPFKGHLFSGEYCTFWLSVWFVWLSILFLVVRSACGIVLKGKFVVL